MISISTFGMDLKMVSPEAPEDVRTLTGRIFVEYLCSNHFNCNTLDDQTTIVLRAINRYLYNTLTAHRSQKIAAHKEWIRKTATDPYAYRNYNSYYYFEPALVINHDSLSSEWCITKAHGFFNEKKTNLDPTLHHTLLPDSLLVGPSGNTAYYNVIARKDGTCTEDIQFENRYRFKLFSDGSIDLFDKENLNNAINTQDAADGSFCCYNDSEHTKLVALKIIKASEECVTSHIIFGSCRAKTIQYTQSRCHGFTHYTDFCFMPHSITIRAWIDHKKNPCCLSYHYNESDMITTCSEHFVALDDANTLSIAKAPHELKNYLLECPFKKADASNPHITPAPEKVIHIFKPNEIYPLEAFEQWKALALYILKKKLVENPAKDISIFERECTKEYLDTLTLEDHARYYQVDTILNDGHCGESFSQRLLMRRNDTSTVYCDMYGSLHYCPHNDAKPIQIDCMFFKTTSRHDLWLRQLVPIGPLQKHTDSALRKDPAFALQCTSQEFIKLIQEDTLSCAQQTWDNGILGAAWAFTNDGMHIRLYNLQNRSDQVKRNPIQNFYVIKRYNTLGNYAPSTNLSTTSFHLINCYKIPNLTQGTITNVIYTEGEEPVFYVDGNAVRQ